MISNVSDLDIRLIRIFLAIVEANGISAAQSKLNVGQSTLSTQLNTLETRLGFRLCERGRGGFRLTAKGEKFAVSAHRLLDALNEFGLETQSMEKKLVGTLHIGLIGHIPAGDNTRLSGAIRLFRQRDEAVRLNLIVRSPNELEEMLLNGTIQIAIGYFWRRVASLRYTPLLVERQVAYCGAGHPLFAQAGEVDPDVAAAHNWAWRGYPTPKGHPQIPQRNITAVTSNMEAMSILILSGQHLGYLPEEVGDYYVARGEMAALNPKKMSYRVTIHVVTSHEAEDREMVAAFLSDLTAVQPDPARIVRPRVPRAA
jgi:DNA-binding transcriptional LysR family regulator